MALLDNFVRSYNNKSYKYTELVRHQGILIGFAMDSDRRIYYTVLNLQDTGEKKAPEGQQPNQSKKSPLDVEYWSNQPVLLPFPREISRVGYAVLDQIEISRASYVDPQAANAQTSSGEDLFLKTTARLSADAPFQVISDGDNLYLFRQAVGAIDPQNLPLRATFNFKSTGKAEVDNLPLVNSTLLCDRYILVGNVLQLKQEVRYQRSRSRTRPQSDKDSLDILDLDGNPFFESTQELPFVENLSNGRFSLLLLPTQAANQQRWQIFAYNNQSKTLDLFNLDQAANGLFTLANEQPLPTYDPPTEFSLKFNGKGYVALKSAEREGLDLDLSQGLTIEAWVYPERLQTNSRIIELSDRDSSATIFLANSEATTLRFSIHAEASLEQYLECDNFFETGRWIHVAVSVDASGYVSVYKNGESQSITTVHKNGQALASERPQFTLPAPVLRTESYLGKGVSNFFVGSLDEVRVWTTTRSARWIKRDRTRRFKGNETGLWSYWRCNEGSGTQIYDAVQGNHGYFEGEMSWSLAVPAKEPQPESFLKFDGTGAIRLGTTNNTALTIGFRQGFTVEAWVCYDRMQHWSRVIELSNGANRDNIILANMQTTTTLNFSLYLGSFRQCVEFDNFLEPGRWMHVAVTIDAQGYVTVYKNGRQRTPDRAFNANQTLDRTRPKFAIPTSITCQQNFLGKSVWANDQLLIGNLDEVRLWSIARSAEEIQQCLLRSLEGDEPGLLAYWRCDEGSGTQVFEEVQGYHGTIEGGASWKEATVTRSQNRQDALSPARLGVQPDAKIAIPDRTFAGGLSATLYYQQENSRTGYDGESKPLKQSARVMLAMATCKNGEDKNYVTLLDIGLSQQGRLAQIPTQLKLDRLPLDLSTSGQSASTLQTEIVALRSQVDRLMEQIRQIEATPDREVIFFTGDSYNGEPNRSFRVHPSRSPLIREPYSFPIAANGQPNSVKIPLGVVVTLFPMSAMAWMGIQLQPIVLRQDTPMLMALLAKTSGIMCISIEVRIDPQEQAVYEQARSQLFEVEQQLRSKQADLERLAETTARFMPLVTIDPDGFTVAGGIADFAWTKSTPQLFDSATGQLTLYFQGKGDEFFSIYYQTLTARAQFFLTAAGTKENSAPIVVVCNARAADAAMDQIQLSIDNCKDDRCTFTIKGPNGTTEVWNQMPRDPRAFAATLMGQATQPLYLGKLRTAIAPRSRATRLVLAECLLETLSPYGVLQVGGLNIGVAATVELGITTLEIEPTTTQQTFNTGSPIYLIHEGQQELIGSLVNPVRVNQPITQLKISSKIVRSLPANAQLQLDLASNATITLKAPVESGISAIEIDSTEFPNFIAADSPVYYQSYNYGKYAKTDVSGVDLSAGSRLLIARDATTANSALLSGTLINPGMAVTPVQERDRRWIRAVKPNTGQSTPNCRWIAANTGGAIDLQGQNDYLTLANPQQLKQLSLPPGFTVETWIKPKDAIEAQVLTYVADAANSRDGDRCVYQLGILPETTSNAYKLLPASPQMPKRGYIWLKFNDKKADFSQGLTLETWVNLDSFGSILNLRSQIDLSNPKGKSVDLWMQLSAEAPSKDAGTGGLLFYWSSPDMKNFGLQSEGKAYAPQRITLGTWTHIAVSITAGQAQIYCDGVSVMSRPEPVFLPAGEVIMREGVIGAEGNVMNSPIPSPNGVRGVVDDIRIWFRSRSQQEIQDNSNRRLFGNESGLFGYWYATDEDIAKRQLPDRVSGPGWTGYAEGNISAAASRFSKNYYVYFGANDRVLRSKNSFPPHWWTHIAATFEQSYGIEFNGRDTSLNCGNDTSLDIQQDLTIEVFVSLKTLTKTCGLLSKGQFNRSNTEDETYDPSYALWITPAGQIALSFKDNDTGEVITRFSDRGIVTAGVFRRIGVTRRCVTEIQYKKDAQGNQIPGDPRDYTEIRFHSDRGACGTAIIEGRRVWATRNNQPLVIGKACTDSGREEFCEGIIAQVRLWNSARSPVEITKPVSGGLVSWWKFAEREGKRAEDSQGSNHARFQNDCQWVKTPDPEASPIRLYANGDLLAVESITLPKLTDNQFTLGAVISGGNPSRLFKGTIEETRLWKTVRTPEQILDNVFRQLMGEQNDLLAYYPYALGDGNVLDESGNGNSLIIKAANPAQVRQPSDAPISLDAPQVRNALGGSSTPFNGLINSTPAVHEYADMQYNSDGAMIGVFKRCYSYIQNNQWKLLTGFKVGDLDTEWIGQVQFAPQIIGFIEGAPPVPSENLTRQANYNEASSIELQSAQSTIYTYDSSFAGSALGLVDFKFQFGLNLDVRMVKGAAVGGIVAGDTPLLKLKLLSGIKASLETEIGGSQAYTRSKAKRVSQLSKMTLQGTQENAADIFAKDLGRRYVPKNVGFALVQSETADVFALRLRHKDPAKRVLISYQMMPNPDIPKDWNVINFPINPRYTKQGTLDGKVGLNADRSYPNSNGYSSDRSYFKPREAYALKNEIDKQDQQLKALYDSARTVNMDRVNFGKSNLVNTYVWTADGGLFTEASDSLEVYRENFATWASFKAMVGSATSVDITTPAGLNIVSELNLMGGLQIRYNEAKTRESQTSFNLDVSLNPERDIYQRDRAHPDEDYILLDRNGDPKKQPGKVDAYRFMTFYLEPSKRNFQTFFSSVIDPIWLAQSKDPSAIALREAQKAPQKPPCWRIFHRVTYVSRVLPEIPSSNAPLTPLEQTLTTLPDINSNYELIQKLDPFVRDRKDSLGTLAEAIQSVLESFLPELLIHREEIVQFMAGYYGLTAS